VSPLVRQWLVLAMLPRAPRSIDTAAIEARLRDRGLVVHRRTLQRDLVDLAALFPIEADEHTKPYAWRWSADGDARGFFAGRLPGLPRRIGPPMEIVLRPSPALAALLEALDAFAAVDARVRHDPSHVTAMIEDSPHARRVLLGHADAVEVLSPTSLRRELATRARRILESHEKG